MFSLESPHRDDSNGYTQYTIFNIKKKMTLYYTKSVTMGFFPRDSNIKRGAVVEWLEQFGYGAESRRIA